jgi:RNA polymerase sigma-70 factor (ECF subfamily)
VEPFQVSRWIENARRGDGEAAGELLRKYRAYLRTLAERELDGRLPTRIDASDVVQQTFLEAHRDFAGFRGATEAELVGWLKRILEHNVAEVVRNHTRVQKRAVGQERRLDDSRGSRPPLRDGLASGQSSPSQRVMRGEDAVRLAQALEHLPEDQREAVRLRHLEGWSLAQIAEHMERTPAAAAGLIKRGMRALRKQLGEAE